MKLGITQIVLGDLKIADTIALCRDAGHTAVELTFKTGKDLDPALNDEALRGIAKQFEQAGITISSVITALSDGGNLLSRNPADRAKREASVRRAIEIGGAMGVGATLLHPGALSVAGTYEEAWTDLRHALRQLAPHAAKHKVAIGLENVWNKFMLSPREARQMVDEVGSEWVGIYLDTANMMAYGYPEHWIRELGKRIVRVHLKDFKRREHKFVPLTEGDTDWPTIMAELRQIGYAHSLIHECDGPRELLIDLGARMRKIAVL